MTSYASIGGRVADFAVDLALAARIFTLAQIEQHPDVSWRTQPRKRASELLRPYADRFDKLPGPTGQPYRWRLSNAARKRLNVTTSKVSGVSQKSDHWLMIGSLWMALTFAGGRPIEWRTEWDHQFDVYCVSRRMPLLVELQRTKLSTKQWRRKWESRVAWYKVQKWQTQPRVILVATQPQEASTIQAPRNTIVVKSVDDVVRIRF